MSKTKHLFNIHFISNGEKYELFVKELCSSSLVGLIEIGDFVRDTHSTLVVDPSHERLKSEFADVKRTYIPRHNVLRIDEVKKKGVAKVSNLDSKVAHLPVYTIRSTRPRALFDQREVS